MQYISRDLDVEKIQECVARDRRALVRDFFEPEVAVALARAIDELEWSLVHRDAGEDRRHTDGELRLMSVSQRAALTRGIHVQAETGFQFSFFSHSIVHSAQSGDSGLLTRFVRWMTDDPFLSLMRDISGVGSINRLYAQATMYSRGSFLLTHDDHVDAEDRKLAYVINLTRRWRPDWGGLLHFTDSSGNVVDTYFPHFNSVSLFLVPQSHFVSYVPPFAGEQRHAITGWLIAA